MPEVLDEKQIEQFISGGYLKIENAFSPLLAAEAIKILWNDSGAERSDPTSWTKPVVRLGDYKQLPFRDAANTPLLCSVYNDLVGRGRWVPRDSLGTFVIRFPNTEKPNDTGWHVDASFPGDNVNDFLSYRVNFRSKGRALLMLFIFSDVGQHDAPTRIIEGSHLDVAKLLRPYGEKGVAFMDLGKRIRGTRIVKKKHVLATGSIGTVYLCHPFLVHAGQAHQGTNPRVMAQPPLFPATPFELRRQDAHYSPVEMAIRKALGFSDNF